MVVTMTFASVSTALETLFSAVPGLATVERGDGRALGKRGSLRPEPSSTPLLRITRQPEREQPLTHDPSYDVWTPYTCELWAYTENPSVDADAFADLASRVRNAVRFKQTLDGLADTAKSTVLQVSIATRPVGGSGPRPMVAPNAQNMQHDRFIVQVREEVRP